MVNAHRQGSFAGTVWLVAAAWIGGAAGVLWPGCPSARAGAFQEAVDRSVEQGITFLEKTDGARSLGLKVLMGLTLAKYGAPTDHPRIVEALEQVKTSTKDGAEGFDADIYTTGIAIMFLVAVDPSQYRDQIAVLVKSLHDRQKEHGAWGYPEGHQHAGTCDTSMTQYAVLGLWEAQEQAGVPTPIEVWERLARWLILTQNIDGGFGYQGMPAEELGKRIRQKDVKHSMTAAGAGSVYIVRDQLGFGDLKKPASDETPPQLRLFETDQQRQARVKTQLDRKSLEITMVAADRWMLRHLTISKPKGWLYYYLYALERYKALYAAERHGIQGKASTPVWYRQGATLLMRNQHQDEGYWVEAKQKNNPTRVISDTCFAILFLLRSTKKSLESRQQEYRSAVLVAGRGLPETDDLRVRDGRVVVKPRRISLRAALATLSGPSPTQASSDRQRLAWSEAVAVLADAAEGGSRQMLKQQAPTLSQLAVSAPTSIRVLAVRAIGRSRDLDFGPLLLFLLSDDDPRVALAARDTLRRLARRSNGFGFSTAASDEQQQAAIERWIQWYQSVRPDIDLQGYRPPSR